MTKPKNRVYCPAISRSKMLFETKDKAERFIKFNESDLRENGTVEFKKLRTYYCEVCGGWHITHAMLSKEEAEKRDNQVKNIISTTLDNKKKKSNNPKHKCPDEYEFVQNLDLRSFGGKKKLRKYLIDNPNVIPDNLEKPKIFHIIREIPIEYFSNKGELHKDEKILKQEEIQEKAKLLYSELPIQKLTNTQLLEEYIKWEFIYKRHIPFIIIIELYRLCGLR